MQISTELFESWQECLEDFHKGVKKDLGEIRKYKNEIQQLKMEIFDRLEQGTYIKDDHRIILSAPEIIIGNVDESGILRSGDANVIIRGSNIGIEGSGTGSEGIGTIICRAPQISQIAVDPGPDGFENTVKEASIITSQARAIALQSSNTKGVFVNQGAGTGIQLQSDTNICINSTLASKKRKEYVDDKNKQIKQQLQDIEDEANTSKQEINDLIKDLKKIVNDDVFDLESLRTDSVEIRDKHNDFNYTAQLLGKAFSLYYAKIAQIAELNREISSLEDIEKEVSKKKTNFEKNSTDTFVSISSEFINISSMDGDGNIRTNDGSGIRVEGNDISFSSTDKDSGLLKDSIIELQAENINITTADTKMKDDKGSITPVGSFTVTSKDIFIESVDYDFNQDKTEEKALTKDSQIVLRTENIYLDTTDPNGKSIGHVGVNSKQIEIKSMDVDKDNGNDKSLTTGSSLLLLSEKVFTGSKDKKVKSKMLQLASDEIAAIGEKTIELQQGKALVQLNGGDTSLSGGKTQFYGATTLFGKTTLKSDLAAGDIDVKNIKIKSSFKSPCTSEGMAVPGAPSTAKLNAKMKEEEFKSTDK